MDRHFTHLHLHTEYSLLDGAIALENLVSFGKQQQFRSLAISDHGNIFGAVSFFEQTKAAGMKPLLGMEAYFTQDCRIKNPEDKYYHLLLLVQNEQGYHNLCALIAASYTTGFYFKPRIDYDLLEKHSEGLIVTSACLGGHIPSLIMKGDWQAARERIAWFLAIFGRDRFYLEVQPPEFEDQKRLNEGIFALSAEYNVKVVATADCHYVHKQDRHAHEVMLAVQTRTTMADPHRFTFGECCAFMRTTEEMLAAFPDHPEVVWQAGAIADQCTFTFTLGKLYFPSYPLPCNISAEDYFASLCWEGFAALLDKKRIDGAKKELYKGRLQEEIELITKMGFVTYFLVVSDFIKWAKRNDIPVGPGRGSVAGSLVAWVLQITDVDPIMYKLLFERFLNPERISMPDIDIDFCIEGRDKVISYVRERYGHDHVCQIITFGTMMAKGVLKDVARALGFPFEDSQKITELIPDQLKITLHEAIEQEPRLKQLIATNPKVSELFDIAFKLEGLTRHASKHAAGVVITPQPVTTMLPVYIPPKSDELVTQYSMLDLEKLGFLKMDFLGLKNLTLIHNVVRAIKKNHGVTITIEALPLDDSATFALLSRGDTSGVFQLESSGLKDVLRRLQPGKFEDIIAVNALYRPGPLNAGMVDSFILRKHGKEAIVYLFPELKPILAETYGVIVYQEQVLHIAATIAGFRLGEADILRKAMGKKKADEMAKQKSLFVSRAITQGFVEAKAAELFDVIAYFAGYGFNKAHSTAYALIAYQTAYLKTHYPAEFMAALISLETGDPENMAFYLSEAKTMGIPLIPPDINSSDITFMAREQTIIFGLEGIRNVGAAALEEILKERNKKPFATLFDLCCRVDLRVVNKRVIESLIFAGACDIFVGNRAQQQAVLSLVLEQAAEYKKALTTGQMSLFALHTSQSLHTQAKTIELPDIPMWSLETTLEREKEVLGMFLTGHPLDVYKLYIDALQEGHKLLVSSRGVPLLSYYGVMSSCKIITTKKGDRMAFLALENKEKSCEVIIFPQTFHKVSSLLEKYKVFAVRGVDGTSGGLEKIKAQDLLPLELIVEQGYGITEMMVTLASVDDALLMRLKELTIPGVTTLILQFATYKGLAQVSVKAKISLTRELLAFIQEEKMHFVLSW